MTLHLHPIIPWIGYFAAASGVAMFAMATMIPLLITGLVHNVASIVFGLLAGRFFSVAIGAKSPDGVPIGAAIHMVGFKADRVRFTAFAMRIGNTQAL